MEKAKKLGHDNGCCALCPSLPETNKHILFQCLKAKRGWVDTTIFYKHNPRDNSLVEATSIIDIINGCLTETPHRTTRLFAVYHTCWSLWNHYNDQIYSSCHPQFLPSVIVEQAREHIVVEPRYNNSHKKQYCLQNGVELTAPHWPPRESVQELTYSTDD